MAWLDTAFFIEDGKLVMHQYAGTGYHSSPPTRRVVTPEFARWNYPDRWQVSVRDLCINAGLWRDEP